LKDKFNNNGGLWDCGRLYNLKGECFGNWIELVWNSRNHADKCQMKWRISTFLNMN